MDFWNKKDLNGPPVLTYITKQRLLNLPEYVTYFSAAIRFTSNHIFLKQEAALLSRVIYKLKCKFSKDKFLNAMQKTNKALLLYLQLDLHTLLTIYKDSMPRIYEQDTYFPTIDMLDFVLVRIQGACKLLIRIRDCARTSASYLGDKLLTGHTWKITLLCLGIVSRLAQIGNEICRYFSNLYDILLKYRTHFKNAGEKWLPDNYAFPVSMQTWLDVEFDVSNTDILQTYDLSLAESVEAYNNLGSITIDSGSDTDDIELVDEYFDLDDDLRGETRQKTNLNVTGLDASPSDAITDFTVMAKIKTGTVVLDDSDEDLDEDRFGVTIDEFGNLLYNEPRNFQKISINRDSQNAPTINNFTRPNKKNFGSQRNDALEKLLPKIFPHRYSIPKKFQQPKSKQQVQVTISKKNASTKSMQQTRSVHLNFNSKRAVYEFLNEQQKLFNKKSKNCLFLHLSGQQFINFRKQIFYVLQVKLPKEKLFEQCREVIQEQLSRTID